MEEPYKQAWELQSSNYELKTSKIEPNDPYSYKNINSKDAMEEADGPLLVPENDDRRSQGFSRDWIFMFVTVISLNYFTFTTMSTYGIPYLIPYTIYIVIFQFPLILVAVLFGFIIRRGVENFGVVVPVAGGVGWTLIFVSGSELWNAMFELGVVAFYWYTVLFDPNLPTRNGTTAANPDSDYGYPPKGIIMKILNYTQQQVFGIKEEPGNPNMYVIRNPYDIQDPTLGSLNSHLVGPCFIAAILIFLLNFRGFRNSTNIAVGLLCAQWALIIILIIFGGILASTLGNAYQINNAFQNHFSTGRIFLRILDYNKWHAATISVIPTTLAPFVLYGSYLPRSSKNFEFRRIALLVAGAVGIHIVQVYSTAVCQTFLRCLLAINGEDSKSDNPTQASNGMNFYTVLLPGVIASMDNTGTAIYGFLFYALLMITYLLHAYPLVHVITSAVQDTTKRYRPPIMCGLLCLVIFLFTIPLCFTYGSPLRNSVMEYMYGYGTIFAGPITILVFLYCFGSLKTMSDSNRVFGISRTGVICVFFAFYQCYVLFIHKIQCGDRLICVSPYLPNAVTWVCIALTLVPSLVYSLAIAIRRCARPLKQPHLSNMQYSHDGLNTSPREDTWKTIVFFLLSIVMMILLLVQFVAMPYLT